MNSVRAEMNTALRGLLAVITSRRESGGMTATPTLDMVITLNEPTVVAALQHYFDTVVFTASVKVVSVKQDMNCYDKPSFVVSVTDPEPKP